MTLKEITNTMNTLKKGVYTYCEYKSEPTPLKEHKDAKIVKVSSGVYRFGISYANIKEVKESGKEIGPLPFGKWEDNLANYVITHTKQDNKTKEMIISKYLRFYTTKHHHTKTQWYLNGEKVSVDMLVANGYISESKAKSEHKDLFIVPIQNVIRVGA